MISSFTALSSFSDCYLFSIWWLIYFCLVIRFLFSLLSQTKKTFFPPLLTISSLGKKKNELSVHPYLDELIVNKCTI